MEQRQLLFAPLFVLAAWALINRHLRAVAAQWSAPQLKRQPCDQQYGKQGQDDEDHGRASSGGPPDVGCSLTWRNEDMAERIAS